jgi:uncharacterized protein (TIGR03382 family)
MLALGLCLAVATAANAVLITGYQSGLPAAAGQSGAADPAGQGWSWVGNGPNAWSYAGDSGNGGWRISDGTSTAPSYYQKGLDAAGEAAMQGEWSAIWTVASNGDIVNATTHLDNWISGTPGNQNNNALWIELDSTTVDYRYILTVTSDAGGNMQISDGTNTFAVTGAGFSQEADPFDGNPATTTMDFVTFTLGYADGKAKLSDSLGNFHGVVATSGSASQDRVVFGATSSGGMGSTTWNSVAIHAVPEPGTFLIWGLGLLGLAWCGRRRRTA